MPTPTSPKAIDAYQCLLCGEVYLEDDLVPLYECSRCGDVGTENRCHICNLFCSRIDDGCECGGETDLIGAVYDHDGSLIPADEWDPDTSYAERETARHAEAREAALLAREAVVAARQESATTVATHLLRPGQQVLDPHGEPVTVCTPFTVDGQDAVVVRGYGMGSVVVSDTMQVADEPEKDVAPLATFAVEDQHIVSGTRGAGTETFVVSRTYGVTSVCRTHKVNMLTITRLAGNSLATIGEFVDPSTARTVIAVWKDAARALADDMGDHAPAADPSRLTLTEGGFSPADNMVAPVAIHLTQADKWDDAHGVHKVLSANRFNHVVTYADPVMLLAALDAAEDNLDHLGHAEPWPTK